MKAFTLIHFVRSQNSDCMPLISETLHDSYDGALLELWKHVAGEENSIGQIENLHLDEFIEAIGDNLFEIRLFDYTSDDDEPITSEELALLFSQTSIETKKEVIDWYFELVRDETTEADYRITEHKLGDPEDNESACTEFNAALKRVTSEQMEQIKQQFSWSEHPLDSKEIIIEIQDGEEGQFNEIVPDSNLIGLVICHQ